MLKLLWKRCRYPIRYQSEPRPWIGADSRHLQSTRKWINFRVYQIFTLEVEITQKLQPYDTCMLLCWENAQQNQGTTSIFQQLFERIKLFWQLGDWMLLIVNAIHVGIHVVRFGYIWGGGYASFKHFVLLCSKYLFYYSWFLFQESPWSHETVEVQCQKRLDMTNAPGGSWEVEPRWQCVTVSRMAAMSTVWTPSPHGLGGMVSLVS